LARKGVWKKLKGVKGNEESPSLPSKQQRGSDALKDADMGVGGILIQIMLGQLKAKGGDMLSARGSDT